MVSFLPAFRIINVTNRISSFITYKKESFAYSISNSQDSYLWDVKNVVW